MLPPSSGSNPYGRSRVLQSWKEIANYLQRGVRTVQRWEEMGLPVRRIGNGTKPPVMADARDLDRWMQQANIQGFGIPQPAEPLITCGLLRYSLQQSRELRDEMKGLRADVTVNLQRLVSSLLNIKKGMRCDLKNRKVSELPCCEPQSKLLQSTGEHTQNPPTAGF